MKNLLLALILGLIMSLFPAFAFAGQGDDDQGDENDQGGIVIVCPPGGCIQ